MANLEHHLGLFVPAGILALEEMTEEFLLQADSVIGVEMRPMLDAMHLEPFLVGSGARESFEIAPRVQALPAPIGGGEQWRLHPSPIRHAGLPVGIGVEVARDTVFVEVAAVAPSCSSENVSGPDTQSPFMRLLKPRVPRPFCTEYTCAFDQSWTNPRLKMPPWCAMSR